MKSAGHKLVLFFILLGMLACQGKGKKSTQSIYLNIGGEPTTLSPLSSVDAFSSSVHGYIFESLLDRGFFCALILDDADSAGE
jgi:hypothetical protein